MNFITGKSNLKILALLSPGDDIQKLLLEPEQVDICYIYKNKIDFFSRCVKRFKLLFPFDSIAYTDEFINRDLSEYDLIILDETVYPERVIRNIRKRNSKCKLIYWMWNTVEYSGVMRFYDRWKHWDTLLKMRENYNFKISSFDEDDCKKYNLIYNNQVAPYLRDITIPGKLDKRIFFFGKDKGRLSYIDKLSEIFTQMGYVCDFSVVPDARRTYSSMDFKHVSRERFQPYREIIKRELPAKALLEVLQDGQGGLTWRALEALFYNKKLITNFKRIRHYSFYHPQNVFILGLDDLSKFDAFMSSDFVKVPDECISQYTFKGWLLHMTAE